MSTLRFLVSIRASNFGAYPPIGLAHLTGALVVDSTLESGPSVRSDGVKDYLLCGVGMIRIDFKLSRIFCLSSPPTLSYLLGSKNNSLLFRRECKIHFSKGL